MLTAIVVSAIFGFEDAGIEVVGEIPAQLPNLSIPEWPGWEITSDVMVGALAVIAVAFAESFAAAKTCASKFGYQVDPNQETSVLVWVAASSLTGTCPLRAQICEPWGVADQKAISATIIGRVQGVGFRFSAARFARDHGVTGWVRNADRGSVEVWAQGDEATLDKFVVFLRQGPRAANVEGMTVLAATPNPEIESFNVRY